MSLGLNQIIKLTSNEGGPITATQNRVSFTIPAQSGAYDLSKSYVNLNCSIESNITGCQIPQVMINNDVNSADLAKSFNIGIVRNANARSTAGNIASIRRVDLLRNTLNNYALTTDEQRSEDYYSLFQTYGQNQQIGSMFRNVYKEGSVASSNKNGVVKIPLDQIFNFGKTTNYDTDKFGRTDINLELNLDKLSVLNYLGATSTSNWTRQSRNECKDLTLALGANLDKLFSYRNFINLEDSPYWVGQQIVISYNDRATNPQTETKTIINIDFLTTDATGTQGQITITLDSPIEATPLTTTETFTDILTSGVDADFTFIMENAEIVLEKLPVGTPSPDDIEYTEFVSEVHTTTAQQNFQRQFFIEAQCMNLYIMTGGTYVSKKNDINQWRFRLDNEDLTNRVVNYHSPLSLDRIGMSFNNSSIALTNSNEIFESTTANQVGYGNPLESYKPTNKLFIASNPLPLTIEQKMVQVNISSTSADISELVLYKEIVSVLRAPSLRQESMI